MPRPSSSAIAYSQTIANVPTRKRSPAKACTSSIPNAAKKQTSAVPCERSWPMSAPAVRKPSATDTRNMTWPSSADTSERARVADGA